MTTKPFPYQRVGIRKLKKFRGRALLADEPGLGKTIQVLLYRKWHMKGGRVVVICPKDAKYVWENQATEHVGVRAQVLSGRTPCRLKAGKNSMYVANFDILGDPRRRSIKTWVKELRRIKPDLVVIDECHAIKDVSTIRYKAVKYLCENVERVIALSGTPATNCPYELWPTLNIVKPLVFKSRWTFAHQFCGPKRVPWGGGWEYKGSTNAGKLNRLLRRTCMIRRTKEEVLTDLPAKIRTVVPLDIEDRKQYEAAEKNLIRWLVKRKKKSRALRAAGNERLLRVGYLRRLAAELKMAAVVEWIEEFLKSGRKLVVFGIHHENVLDVLSKKFGPIMVRVDGTTSEKKRIAARYAFNHDKKIRLFVGNVDAAGTAWSCRSASDVAFCELPWVSGKITQAEDRIHGIGRGVHGVRANIWFLVAHATIEERMVKALHQKQKNLSRVMDGRKATKFDILEKLEEALLETR